MAETAHRIGRLQIEVQAENPERAFAIRQQLRDDWSALLGELQPDFDELARDGQWLHIPRLHFQISIEDTRDFEQRLLPLFRQAVSNQWVQAKEAGTVAENIFQPILLAEQPQLENLNGINLQGATGKIEDFSTAVPVDIDELLEFYLLNGRLPWFTNLVSDWREQFEILVEREIDKLVVNYVQHETAYPCLRLLNLVSDDSLRTVLPKMASALGIEGRSARLLSCLSSTASSSIGGRQQRNWLLARLIRGLAGRQAKTAGRSRLPATGWYVPTSYRVSKLTWRRMLGESGYEPGQLTSLEDICQDDKVEPQDQITAQATATRTRDENVTGEIVESVDVIDESPTPKDKTAQAVFHAGLILLHPYIPRYLKAFDIDLQASQTDQAQYDIAAALLFYLASGNAEPVEYELDVIKLLLGLSPEHPLPLTRGLLNTEHVAEAEQLLNSFISHWPALKATSPDGLRQGFLQRPGLLKETEKHWELTIEASGIDVLLEQLPFTYSIVKLPWMPKSILTEW